MLTTQTNSSNSYSMYYQAVKSRVHYGPLSTSFLEKLVELFDVNIFFETGTYLGDTIANAKKIFTEN